MVLLLDSKVEEGLALFYGLELANTRLIESSVELGNLVALDSEVLFLVDQLADCWKLAERVSHPESLCDIAIDEEASRCVALNSWRHGHIEVTHRGVSRRDHNSFGAAKSRIEAPCVVTPSTHKRLAV